MKELIKEALAQVGVSLWRINRTCEESAELFFVKRRLDMRRMKQTETYSVTVFRDFEKSGQAMRGMSRVSFAPETEKEELVRSIEGAYYAASFVANPTFAMPQKQTCAETVMESDLAALSTEDSALQRRGGHRFLHQLL